MIVVFLAPRLTGQSEGIFDELLDKYVSPKGNVNYKGFIQEKEKFQQYLDYLSTNRPDEKEATNVKLAYWINTYNAYTIKLIIDNYPVQSITELHPLFYIPGLNTVWHDEFFKIEGKAFSLDRIEHEILRKEFDEVRIHFAINCASKSCPNLRNEVFRPSTLNSQLTSQTERFLSDEFKNLIEPEAVEISKIFSWFKGDFDKEGGVLAFINKYSKITVLEDVKISYKRYDWSLNE